ncbi:carbohydrate ABC transporter permease [Bacilliculturomica massiliensis]|uniref:carbohydrate ABC transporter permease n=1 Tax=Bacilliculturomica massiliensis TaxID=1917867 RepID=UPI001FEB062D|nr:sugar ABC transporter permease [Bacilliculturomica massiliensis]
MTFIAPSLIGVGIFVLLPFLDVARRSFMDSFGRRFTGLENYAKVWENDAFRLAAGNTVKFAVVCIPALVISALLLAAAVQGLPRGRDGFKTCFLLPLAVPAASVVLIWKILFHENGLIGNILLDLGWAPVDFMGSNAAFWILVVSYLWKNLGYDMILWMAGLSGISRDLYEAASLDGAGPVKRFFYITLPNLAGITFTICVLSLLNSFKVFREAYLVAGEHPHTSMYMLQHLFNNWFTDMDMEKLCAGAVLMAAVIFGLILLLQKAWGEEE